MRAPPTRNNNLVKKKNAADIHLLLFLFLLAHFCAPHVSTLRVATSVAARHHDPRTVTLRATTTSEPSTSTTIARKKSEKKKKKKHLGESKRRHPPNYWSGIDTIRAELIHFWEYTMHISVLEAEKETPPIPNEVILSLAKRYDLKYAINSVYSGREALAFALAVDSNRNTPSRIIGGRWYADDCILTREVQLLYQHPVWGIQLQQIKPYRPPSNNTNYQSSFGTNAAAITTASSTGWKELSGRQDKWRHQPGRNSWGFWNATTVETELFAFLQWYNTARNRPTIWAPRLKEFSKSNRADLHMALLRLYNTYEDICNHHNLIPYSEWSYFESIYQLVSQLNSTFFYTENITTTNRDGVRKQLLVFPKISELKQHTELYQLVQRHGGRRNVARRFGIALSRGEEECYQRDESLSNYTYGPFSFTFALSLLAFLRQKMANMQPKQRSANGSQCDMSISIPTKEELLEDAGESGFFLHKQILEYGGYENVARRLGLNWC